LKNSNVHIVLSNDSLQIVHQHNYQMGERNYPRIQADEGNYFYYLFKDSYSGLVKYKASLSTNKNLAQGNAGTIKLLQIFNSENEITNKLNVNEKAKINLVLWDGRSDVFTSKCFYKLNGEFTWKEVEFTTDSIKKDQAFVYQHCNLPDGLSEGVYDLKIKFTNPQNHSAELKYHYGLTVGSPEINNSLKIGELPDTSCYAGDVLYYEIPVTGFRYDSCYFEADIFNKDVQLNVVGNELAIGADKASEGNYEIFLRLYKSNSFIEGKSFNLHVNKNDLVLSNEINDTTVYINSPLLVIPVQNVFKSLSDKEIAISIAGNTNPEMAIPRLENGNIYFDFNDYVFGYSTITLKAKTTDSIFTSFIVERQRWSFDYTDNSLPITGFTVTKYLNKIVMPSGSDTIIDLKNWFYHQTTGINEIRKEISYLSNDIIDAKILGDSLQITSKDDFSGSSVIFFKAFNIEGQEILLKIDVKVIEEALNQSPVVSEDIDDIVFSGTYDEQIFINLANKFKDPDGDLISYSLFVEKPSVVNGFIDNNYAVIVPMNGEEMVYSERNKVWEKKWSKWTRASVTATDIHGASTSQVFWIRYGDCNNENNIQIRREFEDLITSSENIANIEYRVDSYFTNTFDAEVTSSNKSIAYGYTNDRDRIKLGSNGEFGTCEITVKAYNPECGFSVSQSFNVTVIPEITEIKAIQDTVVVCKNEHFKLNLFLKGYDSEGSTFDLNSGVSWQDDDGIWDGNREYICNWGFCRTFFAEYNGLYDTLTVCPSQTEDFFDVRYICQGDSAFLGGRWIWEQDYYRDTLQSVQGCDSIGLVLLVITEFNNIPEIVIENYNDICIGDSIRLRTKQHNNDWDYEWSNGKPGQSIYAKESGEYRLRYTAKSNPNCSSEWSEPVMVTFHEPAYVDTSTSICEGKTYEFGTQILTQAGEYTEVFETINGCDSTVFLTLTVNPVYNHTDTVEICQGETYEFGTQSLIQTGEYTEVFESKNGCDSTVTLILTVHPVFNTEVDVSICEGSSHKGWTEPGYYTENLVSVSGCDSTVVTRLSVNDVFEGSEEVQICAGESYLDWNETGTYSRTLQSVSGCDSIVTTHLTVHPVYEMEEEVSICEGASWKGWIQSGTYTKNLVSVFGCDSTVVTRLSVNDVFEGSEEVQICAGESYLDWNKAGSYTRTLQSVSGCDSIVTTHLTVHPVYEMEEEITICEGTSHKGWTESGTYTENLVAVSGCDSTVVTRLSVNDVFDVTEEVEICAGESYLEWNETGTYFRTLQSVSGCDSTVTTHLTVHPVYETEEEITICEGTSYKGWIQPGTYTENLVSVFGCDSTVITRLSVNDAFEVTEEVEICAGESYLDWNKTGTYTRTLQSVSGCDSIVTTHLTMHPVYELEQEVSICEGDSWKGWIQSGTYTENLVSVFGCDSTVVTRLTVNDAFEVSEEIEICAGESYVDWNKTGSYTRTLQSVSGCDSIVTTYLTVYPVYTMEEDISICDGASWKGWIQPGTYTENLVAVSGCDSTVVTRLSVTPMPATPVLTQNADTLTASGEGVFTWYFEDNPIEGAISSEFIIEESGSYSVIVTSGQGCVSPVSESLYAVKTAVRSTVLNNLKVYPNPTSGKVTIEGFDHGETAVLQVFNSSGEKIYYRNVTETKTEIDLSGFASGVYHFSILIQNKNAGSFRVVKK
jgi:hypothetical protein